MSDSAPAPVGREAGFAVDDEVSNSPHPACTLAKSTPRRELCITGHKGEIEHGHRGVNAPTRAGAFTGCIYVS